MTAALAAQFGARQRIQMHLVRPVGEAQGADRRVRLG